MPMLTVFHSGRGDLINPGANPTGGNTASRLLLLGVSIIPLLVMILG